jgi:hypothetical protein
MRPLTIDKSYPPWIVLWYSRALSPFEINDPDIDWSNGFDQIIGAALDPINANIDGADLFWDLGVKCQAAGQVLIDLTLNGLSEYSPYSTPGDSPYPGWFAMTEQDLGDLTIYVVPEPLTVTLLTLGGLCVIKCRR